MMLFFFIMNFTMLLMTILFSMNLLIFKKNNNYYEKITPFECGFKMMNSILPPFSIQFYFMAILFLIFDIEIILLLPLIQKLNFIVMKKILFLYGPIILILLIGLYYEWMDNMIKWFE